MKNTKSVILIFTAILAFLIGIFANSVIECTCFLTLAFLLLFLAMKKGLEHKVEQDYTNKQNEKTRTLKELENEIAEKQLEYEKLLSVNNTDFDKELLNKQKKADDLMTKIETLKETEKQLKQKYNDLSKECEKKQDIIDNFENNKKSIIKDCETLKSEKALLIDTIHNQEIKLENIKEQISHLSPKVPKIYEVSLETIDNMNGTDFEFFVKELLDKLDYYNIEVTSASGDFGVDVIAEKDNIRYAFQCKLYSDKVGNSAVQEVHAGKEHYSCNTAIVITNNYFTDSAIYQAKETGVVLWDRDMLINLMKEARINSRFSKKD